MCHPIKHSPEKRDGYLLFPSYMLGLGSVSCGRKPKYSDLTQNISLSHVKTLELNTQDWYKFVRNSALLQFSSLLSHRGTEHSPRGLLKPQWLCPQNPTERSKKEKKSRCLPFSALFKVVHTFHFLPIGQNLVIRLYLPAKVTRECNLHSRNHKSSQNQWVL